MEITKLSLALLASLMLASCNQSANNKEVQQDAQVEDKVEETVEHKVESEKLDLPLFFEKCCKDSTDQMILYNEEFKKMVVDHSCQEFYELGVAILEKRKNLSLSKIRNFYDFQCVGNVKDDECMISCEYYPDGSNFIFNIVKNGDEYEEVIDCESIQPEGQHHNLVK